MLIIKTEGKSPISKKKVGKILILLKCMILRVSKWKSGLVTNLHLIFKIIEYTLGKIENGQKGKTLKCFFLTLTNFYCFILVIAWSFNFFRCQMLILLAAGKKFQPHQSLFLASFWFMTIFSYFILGSYPKPAIRAGHRGISPQETVRFTTLGGKLVSSNNPRHTVLSIWFWTGLVPSLSNSPI